MWRKTNLLFTRNHQWVDPRSGYSGLTKYALDEQIVTRKHVLIYQHLPGKNGRVKKDDVVGTLILKSTSGREDRWISQIKSPVNGFITRTNSAAYDDYRKFLAEYLFQIVPLQPRTLLMKAEDYLSWVHSLEN